jgi:hypothetical protein
MPTASTSGRQGGVTVGHEDLRKVVLALTPALLRSDVFALVDTGVSTTSVGSTPRTSSARAPIDRRL